MKSPELIVIVNFHFLKVVRGTLWLGDDSCYKVEWVHAIHQESYKGLDSMCMMDSPKQHMIASWASAEDQTMSISRRFVCARWRDEIWMLHHKSYVDRRWKLNGHTQISSIYTPFFDNVEHSLMFWLIKLFRASILESLISSSSRLIFTSEECLTSRFH